jgi:DNA-binding Lrp family transcriptional regulator
MGGALTLAAIKVPEQRFEEVTEIVNAFPEVAHNYARNHALNMWFVLATEHREQVASVIADIEQQTGLSVYNMPKISEYYVGLQLEA